MRLLSLTVGLLVMAATGAAWGEFDELKVNNAGFERVISGTSNVVKTTHVRIGGVEMLDQPSVEFMIEVEYKGETISLVPSDFDIKGIDSAAKGKERRTGVELRSRYWGLPLLVYIDYWRDERNQYQQKSINIPPCKGAAGAVLKRVTIESFHFGNLIVPLAPTASGFANDAKSCFAAIDPKSGKGLCFDLPSGKAQFVRGHSLYAYEEMTAPVENGYETGRLALGAASGKPEAAFTAYRQMLLETRYPLLAKNPKLAALRKRFGPCFAVRQYLPPCSEDGRVEGEGCVAGNKGFVFLFNSGPEAAKALLPLSSPALNVSGDLKLSDWTSLDGASDMGTKRPEDKVEIDVPARGYRVIGVNIDG